MSNASMSSRQRLLAAIRREDPDHVPFSPYIGQGPFWKEPLFWYNQIERTQRLLDLGLDPVIDVWLPDPRPHRSVEIKTWREKKGSETYITKEYHTPAGVLRQTVRETEDWCSIWHGGWIPTTFGIENRNVCGLDLFDDWNISRRTEAWVKGREDLDKLRYIIRAPEGYVLDEWRMDAARAMEFAKRCDVLTSVRRTIVGDAFQWFCDIPWFMLQLYDDPDFVEAFLAIFQDWSLKLVDLALELGVDLIQYRGWYEIPTYWGLDAFKRFLVPLIEEQTARVHQAGKLHSYLLPGGEGAYADILNDMKADLLVGIDPRMLYGGDLYSLFERLGSTKAFWGGVDAEVTLESGDQRTIEQAVKQAVEALSGNGGLILSAFIFHQTPHAAIMHMIEAWKKYCNFRQR